MGYRYNVFTGDFDQVDTIIVPGTFANQFVTDAGTAIPAGWILNVLGTAAQGISNTGVGNTITFTIADAIETQKGVSELATDAEAIAGADTGRTIVPTSLKAKLGTQTANSMPYGTGTGTAIGWGSAMGDGSLMVGSTGNPPAPAFITSTNSSVTITNGSNSINLASGFPITEYVVGLVGEANYQTIQSAIDAANAEVVRAKVYIKAGTYVENLTNYDGIDLEGESGCYGANGTGTLTTVDPSVIVVGSLTIDTSALGPNSYNTISNIEFKPAAGNVINVIFSDAAESVLYFKNSRISPQVTAAVAFTIQGFATVVMDNSEVLQPAATNCDLVSFPGTDQFLSLIATNCSFKTNSGVPNILPNGTFSHFYLTDCYYQSMMDLSGAGTGLFTFDADCCRFEWGGLSNESLIEYGANNGSVVLTNCKYTNGSGSFSSSTSVAADSYFLIENTLFTDTYFMNNNCKEKHKGCNFFTTSDTAITATSAQTVSLSNITVDSSNATAIGGTGTIIFGSVTFLDEDGIAGTITQTLTPILKTGEIHAENIQNMDCSGIEAWGGAGVYYSLAATDLTVERAGTGYVRGKLITWAGSQATGALAVGNTHFIYIDEDGLIGSTTTRSFALFRDNIVLFEVLVDPNSVVTVVREDHPYNFSTAVSDWAHDTIGTVISNITGGANITLNGTKAIQINGDDELEDHGLETDIPDSAATAVDFTFMFTNGAGKWEIDSIANTFASEYNNAGVVAALGGNKFGVFRLYVSKDDLNTATPVYYAVLDTSQYNSLVGAQTAVANGSIANATNELAMLEMAQLGFVIKKQSTDTIIDVIIEKDVGGGSTSLVSPGVASLVTTDVTNFNGWLSAADTTSQAAFETLDDVGLGVTPEHGVLVAGAAYAIGATAVGGTGVILTGSAGADPVWTTATYPATVAIGDILHASAANTVTGLTFVNTATRYLKNTGTGATLPEWGQVTLTDGVTGILPITNGGTGIADPTDHAVLVGSGAAAMTELAVATHGQLIIGNTGNDPSVAALASADGSVTITNGAGTIDLAVANPPLTWSVETGATKTMAVNNGYITNRGGGVVYTLPTTAAVGSIIKIVGLAGLWEINQNAGESIVFGAVTTTVGVGGSLTATNVGDSIEIVCVVADTTWTLGAAPVGNITPV